MDRKRNLEVNHDFYFEFFWMLPPFYPSVQLCLLFIFGTKREKISFHMKWLSITWKREEKKTVITCLTLFDLEILKWEEKRHWKVSVVALTDCQLCTIHALITKRLSPLDPSISPLFSLIFILIIPEIISGERGRNERGYRGEERASKEEKEMNGRKWSFLSLLKRQLKESEEMSSDSYSCPSIVLPIYNSWAIVRERERKWKSILTCSNSKWLFIAPFSTFFFSLFYVGNVLQLLLSSSSIFLPYIHSPIERATQETFEK